MPSFLVDGRETGYSSPNIHNSKARQCKLTIIKRYERIAHISNVHGLQDDRRGRTWHQRSSIIPSLARNDAVRGTALPVHLAQVARKLLRNLEGGEVTSLVVLGLEDEVTERVRPSSSRDVSARPGTQRTEQQGQNTYISGKRVSSPGKYATPRGTDVQGARGAVAGAPPLVIS